MERVYNFSPGPSMLAQPVLEKAQKDLMVYGNTGMSVMEMSHRSKMYTDIFDKTVADLRALMHIGDDYEVLLLQGGALQLVVAQDLQPEKLEHQYGKRRNAARGKKEQRAAEHGSVGSAVGRHGVSSGSANASF